jgi:NADH-quinone oxidoreductase subunit G
VVNLSIDGIEIQVADGTNLVEAAAVAGIEIPTYCYHPGLSVVGQCRICFVEVEGMPRLITACSTPAQDGMVVLTASERVRTARAAVMEFLLENHPLDCPVCDQAGECLLQDYSVEHGLDSTHMVDERRTFPGLERRLIGPRVVQNQNRCIHCTRCIRFTHEISETADLTMKSRGNHSYIDTFDGEPLDNPWSACVADVCPVGALTVKDFRFRARVWHLESNDSICPGCSIGCNIELGHLKEIVHRFLPRENREINGWWMCDYGRSLAEGLNERGIERPLRRTATEEMAIGWREAIGELESFLAEGGPARVVASAKLSNEALYLAKRVFADHMGLEMVVPVDPGEGRRIKNGYGEWIDSVDAHANAAGARLLGLESVDDAGLGRFLVLAEGPILVIDESSHPWLLTDAVRSAIDGKRLAVIGRCSSGLTDSAELLLPLASWAETEGTYTSSTGRVQLAGRAFRPRAQAREAWWILARLAQHLGVVSELPAGPAAIFEELSAGVRAFHGIDFGRLRSEPGLPVLEEVPDVG